MGSIIDKLNYLKATKEQLKQALVNKDVDINANTTFRNYAVKTTENTNLVDTSDADATENDILTDKTAYVDGVKIVGIAEVQEDLSSELNAQDSALSTQTSKIAEVEAALNNKIALDLTAATSDANALVSDIKKDKTAYVNGQKLTGTYEVEEKAVLPNNINFGTQVGTASDYSWLAQVDTSNITSGFYMFYMNVHMTKIGLWDTSNLNTAQSMFQGCANLVDLPLLDFSKVQNFNSTFKNCTSLSNESLNNILYMCANSDMQYLAGKNLAYIGLTSAQATTCQSLSNWDAFVAAGWTSGY